ncbi:hypothetical protein HPB52_020369 [Rhipicephalus sanguineus]|uniref:Uncharacterized protein n=1 Tax=Rhipicephalus sanguineus TaxID=34632 RepID=A0A9D4SZ20_RHISA|nr:hypothetical protein HPB52_020369 [Rhipicephalus sanguineus]
MALEEMNTTILERTPESCDAYLCSKSIRFGYLLSGIASSSQSSCGNLWHKHWMVIFDYGDNGLLVCDAIKDRQWRLIGRWAWEEKTVVHRNPYSYEASTATPM